MLGDVWSPSAKVRKNRDSITTDSPCMPQFATNTANSETVNHLVSNSKEQSAQSSNPGEKISLALLSNKQPCGSINSQRMSDVELALHIQSMREQEEENRVKLQSIRSLSSGWTNASNDIPDEFLQQFPPKQIFQSDKGAEQEQEAKLEQP